MTCHHLGLVGDNLRYTRHLRAFHPLLLVILLGPGCSLPPAEYPIPVQQSSDFSPAEMERPFVDVRDVNAREYVVKDISAGPEDAPWRWTFEHPELRFALNTTRGLRFTADIGVTDGILRQTGPIVISVRVNGRLLGQVRAATPGDRHFEKAVPTEWLRTGEYTRVQVEADKVFVSATDGAKLGFTFYRAGFVE